MDAKLKEYRAVVWKMNSDDPGVHENFFAEDRIKARQLLCEKYGHEIIVSLIDVEAAERKR